MARKFPTPSLFDRAVATLSPARGLARYQAKVRLAAAELSFAGRAIEGAKSKRTRADWMNVGNADADTAVRHERAGARQIARDLVLNNPYVAGAVSRAIDNVVGRGITPQCQLQADPDGSRPPNAPAGWEPISEDAARRFAEQAEALFAEFAENPDICDVNGELTFYEMQALQERAQRVDGEHLLHFPQAKGANGVAEFALELIEVDRLGTPLGHAATKGALIRDGVELDPATHAPIAYWVRREHPGSDHLLSIGKFTRIPRDYDSGRPRMRLIHDKQRIGQTRGYTPFAPCLETIEDLHRYWEAEILRSRIAACFGAFVESPAAYSLQTNAGDLDGDSKRREKVEPGRIWYGQPGEKVTFGNPSSPNQQFGAFTEVLLRAIGVAVGMPWELIALDFSKTNYSSARASLLEARRTFQRRQHFLAVHCCQPVWEQVIGYGISSGRLAAPGFSARRRDYLASYWTPPSWGWVDPVKEEVAARESIRGFLSTHADELAAQGKDFDQVVERCAREHKRLKELGLPSPWDALTAADGQTSDDANRQEITDAILEA